MTKGLRRFVVSIMAASSTLSQPGAPLSCSPPGIWDSSMSIGWLLSASRIGSVAAITCVQVDEKVQYMQLRPSTITPSGMDTNEMFVCVGSNVILWG